MTEQDRLRGLREQIDSIDDELLALINRRAALAQTVAEVKRAGDGPVVYYRPEREAAIRARLKEANPGPLPDADVARLFQEIMSVCRALEQPIRVAFLGPTGTFSEAATIKHFGHAVDLVPVETIDGVFREVEAGACGFGVAPMENSTEGVINQTLDRFMDTSASICGEVALRIHQNLMSNEDELKKIRRVYSHQQSLAQCRHWLSAHLPNVEVVAVTSNAEAARRAAAEGAAAALAGKLAAEAYRIPILVENVEDEPNNTTRFVVIGHEEVAVTGRDKTSLLLSTKNEPGALFGLLEPFAKFDVSMTRIESRPAKSGLWEYVFFVDVEGHVTDTDVAHALDEIRGNAPLVKVLGSFPRAELD